jgi:DNA-binding NarL/FixJ family response regulator
LVAWREFLFTVREKARMITVLLADDRGSVRRAQRLLLESVGDIEIVGMASNGREAVEQVALRSPHVVVMDVYMPVMDGIEATKQICAEYPQTRVLMLSMGCNANDIKRCVEVGALGYVLKGTSGEELVTAIRTVSRNVRYFSKGIAEMAQRFLSNMGKPDAPPSVAGDL